MKEKAYQPISCDYYDELEVIAMRQILAKIIYKDEKGVELVLVSKIKTIQARNGEEFLILEGENEIRLDKLVSVNGKALKKYCGL